MIDWATIDTVLLDMDGTLLDLHFDNYFWLEHLPKRYAEHHKIALGTAKKELQQRIEEKQGSLEWYCLDYWSEALSLNIPQLKEEIKHKIQMRPYVELFLERLQNHSKHVVLVTNAHRSSVSLKLKMTPLNTHLDVVVSSHDYKFAKEQQEFWHVLQACEPFNPARTLFIDDSPSVLDSANRYGIAHILAIHQPDSQTPRRIEKYPAIAHFDEIMPPKLSL